MYDAQLAMMLPNDGASKLDEDKMALLGELEGILQVRGAGSRLQAHAVPIFRADVVAALEDAMDNGGAAPALWAQLAIRQQDLRLSYEIVEATVVQASRGVAAARLELAAQQYLGGTPKAGLDSVGKLLEFGQFVGALLDVAAIGDSLPPERLAEQYLGALSLSTDEAEEAAQKLAVEALQGRYKEGGELLQAMLALSAPELEPVKKEYAEMLDTFVAQGDFDGERLAVRQLVERALHPF